MNVIFENIADEKIRSSFLKVLHHYTSLHGYKIILRQKAIKSSTMQAQPVLNWLSFFGRISKYQIKLAIFVRDSQEIKVSELPKDVLTGWFAHELGHVVDYTPYSPLQMIGYGIKYLYSSRFKKEAEHEADRIAIRNGFKSEILQTKRFILENDFLTDSYKARINKYYMPIEEVEAWQHPEVPGTPKIDL